MTFFSFLIAIVIVGGLLWLLKFIFPEIDARLYKAAVVVGVLIIILYALAMFGIAPLPVPAIY